MLKAVVRKGEIVPLEPLPSEWQDGTTLEVVKAADAIDIDAWVQSMEQLCADSSAEEEQRMQAAIDQHRREAKAQVRRQMGLPE